MASSVPSQPDLGLGWFFSQRDDVPYGFVGFHILVNLFTVVVATTTCSLTTCLLLVWVAALTEKLGGGVAALTENWGGGGVAALTVENWPELPPSVDNFAAAVAVGGPMERFSAVQAPKNTRRRE